MQRIRRPRQIDLPDDVRVRFPHELGTLKHIKVLTNLEYVQLLNPENKVKCYGFRESGESNWVEKKKNCYFFQKVSKNYTPGGMEEPRIRYICSRKLIESPHRDDCKGCDTWEDKSGWLQKRASCSFYIRNHPPITDQLCRDKFQGYCVAKLIENPDWTDCFKCKKFIEKSLWPVSFHLSVIDTGNIALPSIHIKKPRPKADGSDRSLCCNFV